MQSSFKVKQTETTTSTDYAVRPYLNEEEKKRIRRILELLPCEGCESEVKNCAGCKK